MTGILHQGILQLFRDEPWLAFDLQGAPRPVDARPIDRRAEVEVPLEGEKMAVRRGFPDLVMVCLGPDGRASPSLPDGAVLSIEAQKARDWRLRWRLPFFQAVLARDHELPCWMIVVSFSDEMSADLRAWSQGPPPRVDAVVLDVHTVAAIHDPELARKRPQAAVLAAALHGSRGDLKAAQAGLLATRELPEAQRHAYTMTILAAVPRADRSKLMELIPKDEHDPLWEIEMNSGTFHLGLEKGRKEGQEEGRAQGRAQGRKEGKEEGRAQGQAAVLTEMILALLEVRGVTVDATSEARIRGESSLARLRAWAAAARDVTRADALFD
ncbi:hypothetical protein G6O69_11800 [Pseudenhygromyxa sp. WMMC2535]|uniref:hypothetical protein n=1 Tax=Pseudenhygromyxa sp. WMMC2535 TaxID=2712867 RepID=UPI0015524295|nr:hypothetical protein [Pseudenhygromyxa sp. WMMC2535]NVB38515.1 hypothetical protein [Pseudenhygromyxa sp. WMMC2535]